MLAYMDNILDPADADEIGARIEESEFANKLLHRARDAMRRLRIGAPPVTEKGGKGFDPNTVAEYLDNVLPADRVPDFEKVCLDSDMHLAEVAACHQILTLVLGEAAEVDPASRQKMYQLPDSAAAQLTEGSEAPATEEEVDPATDIGPERTDLTSGPGGQRIEIPDYLRAEPQKRNPLWSVVAAIVLVLLAGYILLVVTGNGGVVSEMLGFKPDAEPVAKGPTDDSLATPSAEPAAGVGQPMSEKEPKGAAGSSAASEDDSQEGEPAVEGGPDLGPGLSPVETDQPSAPGQPGMLPEPNESVTVGPADMPADGEGGEPSAAGEPSETEVASLPAVPALDRMEADAVAAKPEEPEPVPPEPVGQLTTPLEVLLRLDPEDGSWRRLSGEATLESGTAYLSLPTYRPLLRIGEGIEVRLVDDTRIRMLPVDSEGLAGLEVEYGRLVVTSKDDPGGRVRLQVGDRTGVIGFGDVQSTAAVEVARTAEPGIDPEAQPAARSVGLYATSGKIAWQEADGLKPVTFTAPVRLTLNDQPIEAVAVEQLPRWIAADVLNPLDRRASASVEQELRTDRSIFILLRELAQHRQREVHWLALRCLAAIDDFEPVVRELDNSDRRSLWTDYIQLLVDALGRGPTVAGEVRAAMEKLHGAEGAKLYGMIWRFGGDGLTKAEGNELVGYLDHDTLAFRVISFWNLKRITGLGLFYEPEETAANRRASIRKWRDRIAEVTGAPSVQDAAVLPPAVEPPLRGRPGPAVSPDDDDKPPEDPKPAPAPVPPEGAPVAPTPD
jgi:hypothetical protein